MKTEIFKIRIWLSLFIVGLVLSGITAFPLETEIKFLLSFFTNHNNFLYKWLNSVYLSLKDVNEKYPFMAYGTDWLAFAHIVIAIFFIGPLINPKQNKWVIISGLIACALIIPLAFICGPIRGIPLYWRLIDCSFGFLGAIPLIIVLLKINKMKNNLD